MGALAGLLGVLPAQDGGRVTPHLLHVSRELAAFRVGMLVLVVDAGCRLRSLHIVDGPQAGVMDAGQRDRAARRRR